MDPKELYPLLHPSPVRVMHNLVIGALNTLQPLLDRWVDYEVADSEKFSGFIEEYGLGSYSCIGISNHIGEIETFYVPLVFLNEVKDMHGYRGAYDHTFHILAKEGLYGEADIKNITVDRLLNQRCNAFGRFIQSLGAVKYFRYARSENGVPPQEELHPNDQMDIIIDEIIDRNKNLVVFPQGHRLKEAQMKAGPLMTYLSLFSESPVAIAPVYIEGDFCVSDLLSRENGFMRFTFREPYFVDKEELSDRLEVIPEKVTDRRGFLNENYRALADESKRFIRSIYGSE